MKLDTFGGRHSAASYSDDAPPTASVAALPRPADRHEAQDDDQRAAGRSDVALRERERESEAFFRAAFDRSVVGISYTSLDGRWLRVNQYLCDLLGYTREELLERTFQDVTCPDDLDRSLTARQRMEAGTLDAEEWDKRYIRKDGTTLWAHITVSLVRTPEGAPDYFITMVQDITERKRMEAERTLLLRRERAARRELEAANTQLQALQALTDIALSHLALDDLLHELLDRVKGVVGADNVAIFLLDENGQVLTMRAARGQLMEHISGDRVALGQAFPGRIAASRASLVVNTPCADDFDGASSILREHIRSLAGVPLLVQDPVRDAKEAHQESRLVGVLVVGRAIPRHFTEADVQFLQRAGDRIALAVESARLYAAEQEARQRAEASLARAQASEAQAAMRAEHLHTILDTIADGVAVLDTDGRIQVANRAFRELHAMEGEPGRFEAVEGEPGQFAALTLCERIGVLDGRDSTTGTTLPSETWPGACALRGEVVSGTGADICVRALDGRELELNASAAPLREPDGCVAGAVVVLRDLTERNRLAREREEARADELAAHEASRRMEEFVAAAAHDLRAPLTAVVGYLDLAAHQTERLADEVGGARSELAPRVDAVRVRLDEASQGADRLTRLLSLLFDTAALRSGKLELHRAPADLAALVCEQVEALRVAAPERAIRLRLPRDATPIPVEADTDRIGQVVSNYVTNALKYSPPDRPVEVRVALRGGPRQGRARLACVTVRDRGPGLPKEQRARVWEPFHRAPGVMVQSGPPSGMQSGSLGLGLSISKAIITAHGGRVGIESVVGEGSTFWFTLPLAGPDTIRSGKLG